MKRRRLRVSTLNVGEIRLASALAHYARDVLRLTVGHEVEIFDGRGGGARATLTQVDDQGVVLSVLERYEVASGVPLTVAMATPKGDRADLAVEKLTELGVTRIVWLVCARSVVVPRDEGKRSERWGRIAEAAAAQSLRHDVPMIEAPVPFAEALELLGGGLIAHPDGQSVAHVLRDNAALPYTCLIGPEGGFTVDELAMAARAGYSRVSLARTVLRSETAAIAAAAAMEQASRDLDT
jgi:16S rRNA (uracil1498-N3)-methyltransferase